MFSFIKDVYEKKSFLWMTEKLLLEFLDNEGIT
jgi:hypothetical protein